MVIVLAASLGVMMIEFAWIRSILLPGLLTLSTLVIPGAGRNRDAAGGRAWGDNNPRALNQSMLPLASLTPSTLTIPPLVNTSGARRHRGWPRYCPERCDSVQREGGEPNDAVGWAEAS